MVTGVVQPNHGFAADRNRDLRRLSMKDPYDTLPYSRSPSPSLDDIPDYIGKPKRKSPADFANLVGTISQPVRPRVRPSSPQKQTEMDRLSQFTPRGPKPAAKPILPPSKASDVHADNTRAAMTEEERMQDPEYRKKVRLTKRVGHTLAITIAAIDGIVTAMAIGSVPFLAAGGVPVMVLIFIAGFMVNRVVYWRSVPEMLKQLFVDGFFKGLSKTKKGLISFSMIFAATLGAGFAALAFKSMCMIAGMTMATAFTVNPPLAIFITFLALCYFVANTSLFFYSLSNMIRRDGHKRIWAFIKKLFTPDKSKHPVEQVLTTTFQVLFTIAGFALGVVAAYAILGKLSVSLGELLIGTANVSKDAAMLASKVVVFGLASVARFAFSIESAVGAFGAIGKGVGTFLYNVGWMIGHWSQAKPRLKQMWRAFKEAQKQKMCGGKSWRQSWAEWNAEHAKVFQSGSIKEKIECYNGGFKKAFSNLSSVKKAAWVVGIVWFVIHIPAILVNAMGVFALGKGGGPHIHEISNALGIHMSMDTALMEASVAAGIFSGSLGMYKYMDLKAKNNDGSKKRPSTTAKHADKRNYRANHQRNQGRKGQPFSQPKQARVANVGLFGRDSTNGDDDQLPLLAQYPPQLQAIYR